MIVTARELGLQIMIGSMNETSIGTAAIVHLLPAVDHADADGPLLLAKDLATGLTFSAGRITVTDDPGLGIAPQLEAL
jgi:L-alanine-DL-glutamate epimerase-like enolase superfamily enzyme